MTAPKLQPLPPFRVIVRDTREDDLFDGREVTLDHLACGLVWAREVPPSLCALAGQAFAKISSAHSWRYVVELATYATMELDEAAAAGAKAETESLRWLLKATGAPQNSSFSSWQYIAMNGGPSSVLARTLIWSVRNADDPSSLMHPAVPPEGATGVDVMSAYALLLFDQAAFAWSTGKLRRAFDSMAEGSLALSYATLDEGNILASMAADQRERMRQAKLSETARVAAETKNKVFGDMPTKAVEFVRNHEATTGVRLTYWREAYEILENNLVRPDSDDPEKPRFFTDRTTLNGYLKAGGWEPGKRSRKRSK